MVGTLNIIVFWFDSL